MTLPGNLEWSVWWPDNPMVKTVMILAPTAQRAAIQWGEAAHADLLIGTNVEINVKVCLANTVNAAAALDYRLSVQMTPDVRAWIIE